MCPSHRRGGDQRILTSAMERGSPWVLGDRREGSLGFEMGLASHRWWAVS